MRGKLIKFQSESVMAYVCLGVTVASLYTLVRNGAHYRIYVKGRLIWRDLLRCLNQN
jgi:predicted membrane chloride channel (bestrophin family)